MSTVRQFPTEGAARRPPPDPILRPCDHGLRHAVANLEVQLGTVEAYNRLCTAAAELKRRVDAGEAKPQHVRFATDPRYIYPIDTEPPTD